MNQAAFTLPSLVAPRVARAPAPASSDRDAPSDDCAPAAFDTEGGFAFAKAILDHVHFGLAVVGADSRLLFTNQAALRECARHPLLRIEAGRLVMLQARHQDEYARALAATHSGRWSMVQLEHDDGRTLLAVVPLWAAARSEGLALVMFGLRDACKPLAIEFYARSIGLTPTETKVLRALGDGLSPREIAKRHGVALSTVRTQIVAIRQRTGAGRITDLVRMLGSLPPIMPAALNVV